MDLTGYDVLGAETAVEASRRRLKEAQAKRDAARARLPQKKGPEPGTDGPAPGGGDTRPQRGDQPPAPPASGFRVLVSREVLGIPIWKIGASGLLATALVFVTRRARSTP